MPKKTPQSKSQMMAEPTVGDRAYTDDAGRARCINCHRLIHLCKDEVECEEFAQFRAERVPEPRQGTGYYYLMIFKPVCRELAQDALGKHPRVRDVEAYQVRNHRQVNKDLRVNILVNSGFVNGEARYMVSCTNIGAGSIPISRVTSLVAKNLTMD